MSKKVLLWMERAYRHGWRVHGFSANGVHFWKDSNYDSPAIIVCADETLFVLPTIQSMGFRRAI